MLRRIALFVFILVSVCTAPTFGQAAGQDTAAARKAIEAWYQLNTKAYQNRDREAILALRAPDFHSITPDGATQDRATMENYIEGFLNGVKEWKSMSFA